MKKQEFDELIMFMDTIRKESFHGDVAYYAYDLMKIAKSISRLNETPEYTDRQKVLRCNLIMQANDIVSNNMGFDLIVNESPTIPSLALKLPSGKCSGLRANGYYVPEVV